MLTPQGKGRKTTAGRASSGAQDDKLDEVQFATWVKQASQLPGERI
jgi:hypothetical protein